jgi:ATP-binding cassette subfamily C protein CydD
LNLVASSALQALDFLKRWRPRARKPLTRAMMAGGFSGIMIVGQAWLLAMILHRVLVEKQALDDVLGPITILALTVVARVLASFVAERYGFAAALVILPKLRSALLDKVERIGPVGLSTRPTGEFVSVLSEGVRGVEPYFSRYLPASVQAAILPLGILLVVAPLDWISGLAFLITAPLIPFFMVLIGKGAEALNQRQWLKLQRMSGHFLDAMQGLASIKAFNAGPRMQQAVAKAADSYRRETMKVLRIAFLSALTLEFFATVSIAIIAVLIGFRLLWGEMSYQHGLFILLLAPEFYLPLRAMGTAYHARMEALGAAERLVALEAMPELARPDGEPVSLTDPLLTAPPAIAIDQVHLTYPGERTGLKGISVTIAAGECVAIAGPSGAGKSSLFSLIMGFVRPDSGAIRINGQAMEAIPLAALRRSIGYIPQQPTLFAGSVASNIALGDRAPDCNRVRWAAERAQIDDRITALPKGFATLIGAGGHALSGGEAQRIGLARAFYRDAPLVLLDEPTAHLDPETEASIHEAIKALKPGRTLLIIAHRAGTQALADRTLWLKDGQTDDALAEART